ncbi:unnamed protein product [Chondrus crispus]|uniref:Uncharacterized protein n=1 Tax=Chondrus crispus TaxID=2769 RepID=R7QEL0_CHOCR|nr:unnamed protein product [Chondrus crispus]CDF36223.1 unnamed protein product [Chondrus crispus]|eukprot:XP_005716042.1 unnamed protein product [Chondrus crispus]
MCDAATSATFAQLLREAGSHVSNPTEEKSACAATQTKRLVVCCLEFSARRGHALG